MPIDLKLSRAAQCLAGGLLLQMALSYPLWLGLRTYPPITIWGTPLPAALHFLPILLSALLALALLLLLLGKQSKATFSLLLATAILASALDLTKCQIWFYFQVILLAVISLKNTHPPQRVAAYLRLLFPFIYFWGGLHKINGYYLADTFPWFMETFAWTEPFKDSQALIILSIVLEIAIAIGLWALRNKKAVVLLGVSFHLSILLFLGPLGQNWNEVVWPWNLVMIALLFLWYWPDRENSPQALPNLQEWKPLFLPLLLIGFCPLLSHVQLWPNILSFKLYTGDQTEGVLYTDQSNIADLQELGLPPLQCVLYDTLDAPSCHLIIDDWAFEEMGVAPFSTRMHLKQVARYFCSCVSDPEQAGLKILQVQKWKTELPWQNFPCSELMK